MKMITKNWLKEKFESICKKLEKVILSNRSLKCKVVYGPFRSRRLGLVLGINNIKSKICSYNCIYCPLGNTHCCSICTSYCLSPFDLNLALKVKLDELKNSEKKIDYIVFAGNGEPTLDSSLSNEILLLREFGYKIAIFTNASMIWNSHIQETLMFADYVSIKIDTAIDRTWQKINRPHLKLNYNLILEEIKNFSMKFQGTITTETTFIKDMNDNENEVEELSKFLKQIECDESYFMVPIYPPAESYAVSPDEQTLNKLSRIIKEKIPNPVLLCCDKDEEYIVTEDFENELLGLLSLHPIKAEIVERILNKDRNDEKFKEMIERKVVKEIDYNNKKFFAIGDELPEELEAY